MNPMIALLAALQVGSANEPPPDVPARRTLLPWPGAPSAPGTLDAVPIEGAPPVAPAIASIVGAETLAAYSTEIEAWVSQNHDQFKSTFAGSPLMDLAVADPVAYNVYTFLLDQAQRRADREILMALLTLLSTDDPAAREYLAAYARRLAGQLSPGTRPSEVMTGDLANLDYTATYEDRFGAGAGTGVVESAGTRLGMAQTDIDLIHKIAGHADLDPPTGKVTVELARDGLQGYLAEKTESYRGYLNTYATGLPTPTAAPTLPQEDEIPPEAIPTQGEFWSIAALAASERLVAVHDLSRAYAYHATVVAAGKVRDQLERMRAGAGGPPGGRTDTVFAILIAHLDRQENELDEWRASAGGLVGRIAATLARSRRALADRTALLAAARAQRDQVETTSTDAAPLGSLPKRPDELIYDQSAPVPPAWASPGTGFDGGSQNLPALPLDQFHAAGGTAQVDTSDPVSTSQGLVVDCKWDPAQGKYVCTVTIPGVGSVQISP